MSAEVHYSPTDMFPWIFDIDGNTVAVEPDDESIGYIPLYKTAEACRKAHPGCTIIEWPVTVSVGEAPPGTNLPESPN